MPLYPGPSQFIKTLVGWRARVLQLIPNWQTQRPNAVVGFRWLWSMLVPIDIMIESLLQGINDWGPGSPDSSPTALPLISQSRGLIQGEAETTDHFVARLIPWRATGAQTGKTEILAQQIQQYLGNNPLVRVIERIANANETTTTADFAQPLFGFGATVDIAVVSTASMFSPLGFARVEGPQDPANPGALGIFYGEYTVMLSLSGTSARLRNLGAPGSASAGATIPAGAVVTYATTGFAFGRYVTANTDGTTAVQTAQWDWDTVSGFTDGERTYTGAQCRTFWSDIWIMVYPGEWSIAGLITPLTGQRVPAVAHDAILRLSAQWKGVHTFVRAIIWSYNALLFDPATPAAAGNPNGTWGGWAWVDVGGHAVPARTTLNVRYWIPNNGGG